jgi:hypothetical protein
MPDLDDLIDALRAETAHARWDDAAVVRARADRRSRRRQVAATVAAAAILLGGTGLVFAVGRTGRSAPPAVTASDISTPTPEPATPTPTPTTPQASAAASPAIPAAALLTPTDAGPGYVIVGPVATRYTPNPFQASCGVDGYPHDSDQTAVLAIGMSKPGATSIIGDFVLAFRPGTAHAVMTGINDLLTGTCRGHFTPVGHDLGGDESVLLRGDDAQQGNAGGRRINYYAIIRHGDLIAWVNVVDYANRADLAAYARTLGTRAAQRMCAPIRC